MKKKENFIDLVRIKSDVWTDGGSYLALVSATLRRRGSFRKPMPWCSLARTHDRMMKSFSLPWKASTLAISTC